MHPEVVSPSAKFVHLGPIRTLEEELIVSHAIQNSMTEMVPTPWKFLMESPTVYATNVRKRWIHHLPHPNQRQYYQLSLSCPIQAHPLSLQPIIMKHLTKRRSFICMTPTKKVNVKKDTDVLQNGTEFYNQSWYHFFF